MLLGEPPPTQADLHFRLFGFPVRVHPLFWIVALLLGMSGGSSEPVQALVWVAVVFVSIVVHELGHAFLQRKFGGHPRITLYGMGGLASCDDCDRSPRSQIIISLAGPVAGFCLAGVVVLLLAATGHVEGFRLSWVPVEVRPFDMAYLLEHGRPSIRDVLIFMLLVVNIFWGVLNLLPIYPLDGGHIAREVLTLGEPRRGIVRSLWLSAVASAVVAAYALSQGLFIMTLLFGYLAYTSYQTIRAYERHWRGGL